MVEAVLHRLDSPELAAAINGSGADPDAERARAEVEQAQAQLNELAEVHGSKEISMSEWLAARRPIDEGYAERTHQTLPSAATGAGGCGSSDSASGTGAGRRSEDPTATASSTTITARETNAGTL